MILMTAPQQKLSTRSSFGSTKRLALPVFLVVAAGLTTSTTLAFTTTTRTGQNDRQSQASHMASRRFETLESQKQQNGDDDEGRLPSAIQQDVLERMVQCATSADGPATASSDAELCDVEEMTQLLQELEHLNQQQPRKIRNYYNYNPDNHDVNIDTDDNDDDADISPTIAWRSKPPARNQLLQQALELQIELQQVRDEMQMVGLGGKNKNVGDDNPTHAKMTGTPKFSSPSLSTNNNDHNENAMPEDDHSYNHFVDYRSMGEFESH